MRYFYINKAENGWLVSDGGIDRGSQGKTWLARDNDALGELVKVLTRTADEDEANGVNY